MSDFDAAPPPHSIPAEHAVLSSILVQPEVLSTVAGILQPKDFYASSNALIYESILELTGAEIPIDIVLLGEWLKGKVDEKTGKNHLELVGGRDHLVTILDSNATTANAQWYARELVRCSVLRALIRTGNKLADSVEDGADPAELLAKLSEYTERLNERLQFEPPKSMADMMVEFDKEISERYENREQVQGVPTGFAELDRLLTGLKPGQFMLIAGRPSMGKTQTGLNIAYNMASACRSPGAPRYPVAFFSLEQNYKEIRDRLVALSEQIDQQAIRTGQLSNEDWSKVYQAVAKLPDLPLEIVDEGITTVAHIRAYVRTRRQLGKPLSGIIIDHLMHLKTERDFDRPDLAFRSIAEDLKKLAKEEELFVILLHQLSRAPEKRSKDEKRPSMGDLRESGSLEELADIIGLIFREDYYNKHSTQRGEMELIIAKQRNGPIGLVDLQVSLSTGRIFDFEKDPYVPRPEPLPESVSHGDHPGSRYRPHRGASVHHSHQED